MSKSFLPPEDGVSTKASFVGVEPGSALAQRLYHEMAGHISHFQQKARMARGDSPSAHMHQSLPGGGRITYSYNNGLENIQVQLNPREIARVEREQLEPRLRAPIEPLLAIDVVFDPKTFETSEIFSHTLTEKTIVVPGAPTGDPDDPNNWDFSFWSHQIFPFDPDTIESGIPGVDPNSYFESRQTFMLDGLGPFGGGAFENYSPVQAWLDQLAAQGIHQVAGDQAEIMQRVVFFGWTQHFSGTRVVSYYQTVEVWDRGDVPAEYIGPRGPDRTEVIEVQNNFRERRTYFDVLSVVGARVEADPANPNDVAYEAVSTGDYQDGRLRPLTGESETTIQRMVPISDPQAPGFMGAGFLAMPKLAANPVLETPGAPPPPQVVPQELVVDIYLASINVTKHNEFPGQVGATFDADNPQMEYDYEEELSFRIRAREIVGTGPYLVKVSLDTEGRIETFDAPEGAGNFPDHETGDETVAGGRQVDWLFAATPRWTDSGNEPADPTAVDGDGNSTMGELLADSGPMSSAVIGPQPLPREVLQEVVWEAPVTMMTKVATIRWTPPERENEPGTATIEPA